MIFVYIWYVIYILCHKFLFNY